MFKCKKLIVLMSVIACPLFYGVAEPGSLKNLEAGKEYGEKMLRPVQIKACVLFGKRLDAQKSAIKSLSRKLDRTEKELHTLKTIVKRGLSSNSRREEIAQYDGKKKKFEETKVIYKKNTEKYNYLLQDYKEDVDRHNDQCKNKEYYEEDYSAVLKMMR